MTFKLLILLTFVVFSSAQTASLTCTYWPGWMNEYFCMLDIDNPEGVENFPSIGGEHRFPYGDGNVDTVYGLAAREGTAKVIPTTICKQFLNLRDLWLDHLDVEFVSNATFSDCLRLESLYLGHNSLRHLASLFDNNQQMRLLDLGSNQLETFASDVFGELRNLERLFLDANHLRQLDSAWFAPLESLRHLTLKGNSLFELQPGVFAHLNHLEHLDVSENHLTVINSDSFGVTPLTLDTFTANHNRINAIDPNFVNSAPALSTFDLRENVCVNEVIENDFSRLENCFVNFDDAALTCTYMRGFLTFSDYLCLLDIRNPHGRDDFVAIGGAHRVGLGDNSVTTVYGGTSADGFVKNVPAVICEQFVGLRDLYLDGLGIEIVSERSFGECKALQHLYLSGNHIEELAAGTFAANEALQLLDLGSNRLKTLPSSLFAPLTSLRHLYLDNNPLIDLSSDSFNTLTALQTLCMANCGITALKSAWFSSLEELHQIHLGDNEISSLPREIFVANRALRVLNINNNKLKTLPADAFSARMDQFSEIYANRNQLESIDREFFEVADSLVVAEFEGNVCVDERFANFSVNREENLAKFEECFEPLEETEGPPVTSITTSTQGSTGNSQWTQFIKFLPILACVIKIVL